MEEPKIQRWYDSVKQVGCGESQEARVERNRRASPAVRLDPRCCAAATAALPLPLFPTDPPPIPPTQLNTYCRRAKTTAPEFACTQVACASDPLVKESPLCVCNLKVPAARDEETGERIEELVGSWRACCLGGCGGWWGLGGLGGGGYLGD